MGHVLLIPAKLADAAKAYVGALSLDDPRASPLFSIPRNLPPILIQVGSEEVLLDDWRRYAVEAISLDGPGPVIPKRLTRLCITDIAAAGAARR
jgi:monoterpene epsilon-lactone hydrolase